MQPSNLPDDHTAAMTRALLGGGIPRGVTVKRGQDRAQRFAVYRNNVMHSLTQALATRFPVIERLVGTEFFAAMARVYIEQHPPRSPRLFEWGDTFAEFLRGFAPAASLPYAADVARIECARGVAYHSADLNALSDAELSAVAGWADRARLVLHPCVQMIRSNYAIVDIWQGNQPGQAPRLIAHRAQTALVLRTPHHAIPVLSLTEAEAAMLGAILAGMPLLEAMMAAQRVDPAHSPNTLIALLHSHQTIISAQEVS